MVDLDNIIDPRPHDEYNKNKSDDKLVEMYVSRKRRGKKTWQLEREIENRPGLMERCRKALKK